MLEELHITDFALIDEALIEFGPGLNVLTGETGAGKTILLAALGLLLGGRADTTTIRSQAAEARVEGRFAGARAGEELVLSRIVSREGKSKCYANGSLVTVAALAELGEKLVDVHGQHEHQALLRVANHVEYLDSFCGPEQAERRLRWRESLARLRAVDDELAQLERFAAEHRERAELLRFQAEEISRAELRSGEEEELAAELELLRNAERLSTAAAQAREGLAADEEIAALETIRRAEAAIGAVEGIDARLDDLRSRLSACGFELEEVASELRSYAESVEFNAEKLDTAEGRMALIAELKRKYGATLEEVVEFGEKAWAELERMDSASGQTNELAKERTDLEHELQDLAKDLRRARKSAAARFEKEMADQLSALAMQKAQFVVRIEPRDGANGQTWSATGADDVEFEFTSNAGEPPKPLAKIASGGEISRLMLAAKIVLGDSDDVPALVFDEIDAGVGGKTAATVGAKLALLAKNRQVICVTHLPQIASLASRHLSVTKSEAGGRTVTSVTALDEDQRVDEIARMLSGAKVSDSSMKHAREMLAGRT